MTTQHNLPAERAAGNHPGLLPLTDPEADHLIQLSRAALAARGLTTNYVHETGTLSAVASSELLGGALFGLGNLARILAREPRQRWAQQVEEHFDGLLANVQRPADTADLASRLCLRLAATSAVPPEWTADLPEFLPGLVAVPALSNDGAFTLHFDTATLGLTRSEAHQLALANLTQLTDNVAYIDHDGAQLAVLSETTWAASRALVLDTVLRESLQLENPEYGVLVALPARDLLLIHVIRDLSVLPALSAMLHLAHTAFESSPGPLTPTVYLVDATGWHPATIALPGQPLPYHLSAHLRVLTQSLADLEEPDRA
ncbi:hypothetical protein EV138_2558 [Kribbella voronezhensis]|uniref:Uncharacterized protein n=1 Tax=Kribbella voronezhensis TaxID=2512212 RepID=A0A4R7TAM6_9ACTN|nr:hypothetical protein [Kribbella voronezhensis]TDU89005.1 hypothetical protein EV138_2558 [Kribbella voronezhensis]